MKISYLWLKEFVEFEASPRQLADDLSMVGVVAEGLEQAGLDTILDFDVTSNRPDCLSHSGVAREVSTRYQKRLKAVAAAVQESAEAAASQISVTIESPQLCSRYCARVIRNVKVAPSPAWLAQRLESLGVRSINNVVDATNYVLQELGHPLHAFDLSRVQGRKIIVREACAQEALVTLDGETRDLSPGMLVIADRDYALALAGVMGGADSEIGFASTDVLLESAWFDPISIRRTAKALGVHTEASHRFERGADVNAAAIAIDRAAALIQQLAGGEILRGVVDAYPRPASRPRIALRRSRILQVMGTEIDASSIERILGALNLEVVSRDASGWQIQLPTSRLDVEREIDLIEEIARHYGYDNFASTLPSWTGGSKRPPDLLKEATLKRTLLGLGYTETLTYAFVAASENEKFSELQPVRLRNPLSLETAVMRTSLVPGLLASFRYNYFRGQKNIRLYEIGRLYPEQIEHPLREKPFLGIIASGYFQEKTIHTAAQELRFHDFKGDIEVLLESLWCPLERVEWYDRHNLKHRTTIPHYYHPDCSAEFWLADQTSKNEVFLGWMGQLHPTVQEANKIKRPVFLAELPVARWYELEFDERPVRELPKFPAVERDLSLVVNNEVRYRDITSVVLRSLAYKDIPVRSCLAFDQYEGPDIPSGKKVIGISVVYQALDRTLLDEEVNEYDRKILKLLEQELGAQLRT